jgi:protein SCO1
MTLRIQLVGMFFAAGGAIAVCRADAPNAAAESDLHPHHHSAPTTDTTRSLMNYVIPSVQLTRQDGSLVNLRDELNDGRPVVLSFIYTSCTTVCPLASHTLSELQDKLGDNAGHVHIVSISIDPEQDDPARLREYAKTFHAGAEWQHYTGTVAASQTVQVAFNVYRGSKMDHIPATLIRRTPAEPWIRIGGFATADQMLAELSETPGLRAAK